MTEIAAVVEPRNGSPKSSAFYIKQEIESALIRDRVVILPPQDVMKTLAMTQAIGRTFDTVMLDPWYNKGFGGIQADYQTFFVEVIRRAGLISKHVYFWGFPEIVAPFVERVPEPLNLVCWLTWYYKNNPSVIRGWRSSQNACLHMARENSKLYPERFLNEKQQELAKQGKLRYMPGPTSVLDEALLVGFVGRKEQTGHPAQKPFKVYDKLIQMTVSAGGAILDPMAGSGTTGAVAKERGFRAILCDASEEYTRICEKRLGVKRLSIGKQLTQLLGKKLRHETSNP